MSNASRGADFERKVRKTLESAGYVVIRSAASKTGVDLVALSSVETVDCRALLVQCKCNGRLDHGEWNVLHRLSRTSGTVALLACQEKQGRRLATVFYRIDGPKTPHQRNPPMSRLEFPEESDA